MKEPAVRWVNPEVITYTDSFMENVFRVMAYVGEEQQKVYVAQAYSPSMYTSAEDYLKRNKESLKCLVIEHVKQRS